MTFLDDESISTPPDVNLSVKVEGTRFATRVNSYDLKTGRTEYFKTLRELQTAQAIVAEAEALPEGPLREHLLSIRPEETYRTTEGTGRNKRTVTRTYMPKNPMQDLMQYLPGKHERAKEKYDEMRTALTNECERLTRKTLEAEHMVAEIARVNEAAWAHGWPEDLGPVPAKPAGERSW